MSNKKAAICYCAVGTVVTYMVELNPVSNRNRRIQTEGVLEDVRGIFESKKEEVQAVR